MLIHIPQFDGFQRSTDKRQLPVSAAVRAVDCDIREGVVTLRPIGELVQPTVSTEHSAPWLSGIPSRGREHPLFVSGQSHASVAQLPTSDVTTKARTIQTQNGVITRYIEGDSAAAELGVVAPNFALEVNTNNPPASSRPEVERYFVVTLVNEFGQEGPPGPILGPVLMNPTEGTITLNVPAVLTQPTFVGKFRIYVNNGNQGDFFFAAEVGNYPIANQTVVMTSLALNNASIVLETTDLDPPPADLTHVKTLPSGAVAGISGSSLVYSHPTYQYGWPPQYGIPSQALPMGIALLDQAQIIPTDVEPFLIQGTLPGEMVPRSIDVPHGCKSERSIVELSGAVGFSAEEGFIVVTLGGHENFTANFLTPKQWQEYNPESIAAVYFDMHLVLFFDTGSRKGSLWFPPGRNPVERSVWAHGAWVDKLRRRLYIRQNTTIYSVDTAAALVANATSDRASSPATSTFKALWESKTFVSPKPISLGVMQMHGIDIDCQVTITTDGKTRAPISLQGTQLRKIKGGFKAYEWSFLIEGTGRWTSFSAASTPKELEKI